VEKEIKKTIPNIQVQSETPEYFILRPKVEKACCYSHSLKIGNHIKISDAVNTDDERD